MTNPARVLVRWLVSALSGIAGFNVYRGLSSDGPFELLNVTPLPATAVGSFTDLSVWPETTFWYQLRAVLLDGSEDTVGSGLASVTTGGELALRLSHAHPNPTAGVYFARLEVGERSAVRRMVLLR